VHDLRRTVATGLQRLGVRLEGKRPTIHVCHIIVADDMFAL
jgi:hypothetical protein